VTDQVSHPYKTTGKIIQEISFTSPQQNPAVQPRTQWTVP
jgi:hypothetical protein